MMTRVTFSRMLDHPLPFFCISCFPLGEKIKDVENDCGTRVDPQLKPCTHIS